MSSKPENPFVGPRPFVRGEHLYGRGRETRELFYLLTAERIVWLHSPSGAGKTSLISAALIPRLERDGFDVLPTIRVNLEVPRQLAQPVNRYLLSTLISLEEGRPEEQQRSPEELASLSLHEYLASGFNANQSANQNTKQKQSKSNTVLVFDQFEEILTIDPLQVGQKRAFFQALGNILQDENRWALFSLREEFLAQLEPYIDWIPTRWNNTLRLDLLGEQAVKEVVKKTASHGGREFTDEAAQILFTDLARTKVQQPDGSFVEQAGQHVEPVQLQVVCRRPWDEMPADDFSIDPEDLQRYGNVSEALSAYYADAVTRIARGDPALQRNIRQWFGKRLITASGIRGQVLRGETKSEGLPNDIIEQLLNTHLVRGEKRAGATWYELAHDRLVQPITDNNAAWLKANLQPFQRQTLMWIEQGRSPDGGPFRLVGRDLKEALRWQKSNPRLIDGDEAVLLDISRKVRRRRAFYGMVAVLFVVFSMYSIYSWRQTQLAKDEVVAQKQALQRQLAIMDGYKGFNERDAVNGSSLKALHYFARAVNRFTRKEDVRERQNALLAFKFVQNGVQLRRVTVLQVNKAMFSADGKRILTWTEDGTVRVLDSHSGSTLTPTLSHKRSWGAIFNADERRILTWGWDGTARLWDSKTGKMLTPPLEHEKSVRGAVYSADGKRILTWSEDDTARVWDSQTGKELQQYKHDNSVWGAVFSVDEKRILTWSSDGTARLWESQTGEQLQHLKHDGSVWGAVFSGDEKRILTRSDDGTARLWDSQSGENLQKLKHDGQVRGAVFSADEKRILTWSSDGAARVWDSQTGEALQQLKHNLSINGALFNADETRILTWSKDGTARLWDSKTGEMLTPPLEHEKSVRGAVYSADGKRILTWSEDDTARTWDSQSGAELSPPLQHKGWVLGADFTSNDKRILTWGRDGTMRFWDSQSINPLMTLMQHEERIHGSVFSADNKRMLTWSEKGNLLVWNSQNGNVLVRLRNEVEVDDAVFSTDNKYILIWNKYGTAQIWDSRNGDLLMSMENEKSVDGAVFSANNKRILIWHKNGTARVWNIQNGEQQTTLLEIKYPVHRAVFSADGQRILTWSEDNTARVWDSQSGKELRQLKHESKVGGAVFSADDKRILTWSSDGTARVWDSLTGMVYTSPLKHEKSVRGAVYSADGKRILTWSEDGTARLWDSKTGEKLIPPLQHKQKVLGAVFSADDKLILTWSEDRTARVWDSQSGVPLTPPLQHREAVGGAVFSADVKRILTWSEDSTARLWDSNSGESLTPPLQQHAPVRNAIFSTDDKRILTWSKDKTARIWNIAIDANWPSDKIILRTEVETGTELISTGEIRALSANAWQEKKWCQYDRIQYDLKRIDEQQWRTSERLCNELKQASKTEP